MTFFVFDIGLFYPLFIADKLAIGDRRMRRMAPRLASDRRKARLIGSPQDRLRAMVGCLVGNKVGHFLFIDESVE